MARKSKQQQQEEAAEFFQKFLGVSAEEVEAAYNEPVPDHEGKMLQAEGVLLFLQSAGRDLKTKKCKECKQPFATRYINVAYCGDTCRADALRKVGIKWDRKVDHYSQLNAERPAVVSRETYNTLLEFAHRIIEDTAALEVVDDFPEPQLVPQQVSIEHQEEVMDHTNHLLEPVPLSVPEESGSPFADLPVSPFQQ